jgi:hypothetical protein
MEAVGKNEGMLDGESEVVGAAVIDIEAMRECEARNVYSWKAIAYQTEESKESWKEKL